MKNDSKLSKTQLKAIERIDKVKSISDIKRKTVYQFAQVSTIDFHNSPSLIIKTFKTKNPIALDLFQREKSIYQNVKSELIPKPFIIGKDFVILEKLALLSNESIPITDEIAEKLGELHKKFESLPSNEFTKGLNFTFFGDRKTYLLEILRKLEDHYKINVTNTKKIIVNIEKAFNIPSKYFIHGDVTESNLMLRQDNLVFIDFECLSNLPLEYDLVFIFRKCNLDKVLFEKTLKPYFKGLGKVYKINHQLLLLFTIFDSLRRFKFNLNAEKIDLADLHAQIVLDCLHKSGLITKRITI